MNAGVATLTGLSLMIGAWLYWHKNAPKTTTLLFLIAGVGLGGWLGTTLGQWVRTVLGMAGSQTATWLGIGASTLLAGAAIVATLEIAIKGLWKKKAKPKRWHPWLALALPTVVAVGSVPLLSELFELFSTAVIDIGNSVTSGTGR
jgi:hypothetical protein